MEQCLVFCRTNFDCDNLEKFLNGLGGGGGGRWAGRRESGKENPYSCCVLAGARSTDQRREALQVPFSAIFFYLSVLSRLWTAQMQGVSRYETVFLDTQCHRGRRQSGPTGYGMPNEH